MKRDREDLSRRDFVKGITVAGVATAAASAFAPAAALAAKSAASSASSGSASGSASVSASASGSVSSSASASGSASGSVSVSGSAKTAGSASAGSASTSSTDYKAGDWSADGEAAKSGEVPASKDTNASSDDGSYRVHNGNVFPANDASAIAPLDPPDSWDLEADVVVIGAGGGGLNAAARAAEKGASVICVESMGMWGGNAQSAAMAAILGGSKLQDASKFAFPSYPFDPKALADWAMDEYHYAADPHLIYLIADSGGKCIDWMADCGVEWRLGEVPVYVAPKNSTLDHHVLKQQDATNRMHEYGVECGVDFHFNCPARALYQDADGRIVGVKCETLSGDLAIHAIAAVILTAGGFCNNKALLDKYIPTAAMGCASSYLVAGEEGDCFRMGLGVHADISGFNSSASFDGGVDWEAEGGDWARFLYDGMTQLSRQPFFTIDRCGNRMRYLDSRVAYDGANSIYALGDLATIQMTCPGHRSYIIFDSHYEDHLATYAQENCRKLITPDLEQIEKVPEHYRNWHNGVQDAIDADVLKKRDTLEELEADLGFEKGVLTDAVAKWNETCAKGEDDYEYPMPSEWLFPITDGPFYGCRIGGNLYGTKCGLLINDQMQVVATNGKVIPGLYAGWHTAGGACGENSYIGDPILGSLLGDVSLAYCGGYLCGTFAVDNEL